MEKVIEISQTEIENIFKVYLEEKGLSISSIRYTPGGLIAYIAGQDKTIEGMIGKIRAVVEYKPIQVKIVLTKHLENNKILVRNIKFSGNAAILYTNDSNTKAAEIAEKYDESFVELGCSTRICNCLKSIKAETVGQLVSYLKEFTPIPLEESAVEKELKKISGMGKGLCRELIELLKFKKIII